MNDMLTLLYEALRPDISPPEERAILKREEAFLDEMERRLGVEDFTRFWNIMSEMGCQRAESEFRLGFWAGAKLVSAANAAPFPQK